MKIKDLDSLLKYLKKGFDVQYIYFLHYQDEDNNISSCCFSQWYESSFLENGIYFKTATHYMMFQKAMLFGDSTIASKIINTTKPNNAKKLGRLIHEFDEKTWIKNRFKIVVQANYLKFTQNPELKEYLINTKNRVLVEASPVDKVWGVGMAHDNEHIQNPNLWKGLNLLGFALMQVRANLQSE